jgi:thiol-disulfide isomerase/thioredoxin
MSMRFLALSSLMFLETGCGNDARNPTAPTEAAGSTDDLESGQGRAIEAGRALIGKAAPVAVFRTIDGESVDLGRVYGRKPVHLTFWATWCVPCRQQMPGFEADYEKYRDQIVTVAINTGFNDNEAAVRDYRRRLGLQMPITIDDGSLGEAFNLRVTPQHVVIGRSGRVLFVGHEADSRLHDALAQAIREPGADFAAIAAEHNIKAATPIDDAAGFPIRGAIADGRPRVLVFFSPWCESYLEMSRPADAAACRRVREEVNNLAIHDRAHWLGVASGIWSSAKDLNEYRATKALPIPLYLDESGQTFRSFKVQQVPTVIILDNKGRVARRLGPRDGGLDAALHEVGAAS